MADVPCFFHPSSPPSPSCLAWETSRQRIVSGAIIPLQAGGAVPFPGQFVRSFDQVFAERRTRAECARLSEDSEPVASIVCTARRTATRHSLFLARTAIDKAKRLMKYYTVRIYAYQRPSLWSEPEEIVRSGPEGNVDPEPHDATTSSSSVSIRLLSSLLFYSIIVACSLSSHPRSFHAIFALLPQYTPFVSLSSLCATTFSSLSLSISVSLSLPHPCPWIRSYLMYSTPPSSAGRTLVRLVFDALTTRYFRVDLRASLIPTTPYIYVPVVPWSTATREFASRLDPTGWDLRTCRAPWKTFLQARWEPWTEGVYTFTWTPR